MRNGFAIKGMDKLMVELEALIDHDIANVLRQLLETLGEWLLKAVQDRCPVDTSNLRDSFVRGAPENIWRLDLARGMIRLELGSTVDYATPVEEGHWMNPEGVATRWVPGYWTGDKFTYDPSSTTGMALKQQWIPGYHMFEIAIEQIEVLAPGLIGARIQEVFDRAAKSIGV